MTHSPKPQAPSRPTYVRVTFSDKSFVEFGPDDVFGGHCFTSQAAMERFVSERYAAMRPDYTLSFS